MASQFLPFPEELRPRLPTIVGNVDYLTLRRRLEQIDALLRKSGVERDFLRRSLDRWVLAGNREPSAFEQIQHQNRSRRALRCNLLRTLLQENHAQLHRDLLDREWKKTRWTRPQTEVVLRRIDGVMKLLPQARRQAHERIIGGRPVENSEKILSLYETDVRVIVRRKAGAEVEFGNTVLIGENRQGVIVDYHIFQESAPADSQTLFSSLVRVREGV